MHTRTLKKKLIAETFVVREDVGFVTANFSFNCYSEHTAKEEALRNVYTELLQSGCAGYTRDAFQGELALLGVFLSIRTNDTHIQVSLKARSEVLGKTLPLLKKMFSSPSFHESELKRIKGQIKNLLKLHTEDARARAEEQFINNIISISDWRYEFDTDVLTKAVEGVSIRDLKKFHTQLLRAPVIAAYGGREQDCKKVSAFVRSLASKEAVEPENLTTCLVRETCGRAMLLIDIPSKQNIEFSIGASLPITIDHIDYPALVLGFGVLGLYGGFSGRLMSSVREKEGLTYSIYARIEGASKYEEGYWRIMTFFSPKDAMKGVASTIREITNLCKHGITEDELVRFKTILTTRALLIRDSLLKTVAGIHDRQQMKMSEEEYKQLFKNMASLTTAQVNAVLKKYIAPENLIVSGAGPVKGVQSELKSKFS